MTTAAAPSSDDLLLQLIQHQTGIMRQQRMLRQHVRELRTEVDTKPRNITSRDIEKLLDEVASTKANHETGERLVRQIEQTERGNDEYVRAMRGVYDTMAADLREMDDNLRYVHREVLQFEAAHSQLATLQQSLATLNTT
jgi:hypothetical protein